MRQRTTIALATILKPKIIFADEPPQLWMLWFKEDNTDA